MAEIIGNEESMLDRAFMMLEDEEFEDADSMLENVLNLNSRNPQAYIGKLMVELKVATVEELPNVKESFEDNKNYKRALKFANEKQKVEFVSYCKKNNNKVTEDKKPDVKVAAKPEVKVEQKVDAKNVKVDNGKKPVGQDKKPQASVPVFNTAAKDVPDELKSLMINNNAPDIDEHATMEEGKLLLQAGKYELAAKKFDDVIAFNSKNAEAYMCKLCTEMKVPEIGALITVKKPFTDNPNYKKALEYVTDPMDKFQYESLSQSIAAMADANKKAKEEAQAKVRAEAKAREEEAKKKAEEAKKLAEEEKKKAEEEKKKAAEEYEKLAKAAKEKAEKEKAEQEKAAKAKAESEKAEKEKAAKEAAAAAEALKQGKKSEKQEAKAEVKAEKKDAKEEAKVEKKEAKAEVKAEAKAEKVQPKVEPVIVKKEEPKKVEPVKAEPKKEEPKKAEPVKAEPKKEEPKKAEPVKAEPKKEEPKKAEPAKTEPKKADDSHKVEAVENAGFNIKPEDLIKSAFLMIADMDFDKAEGLLDKSITINPNIAQAYIGKLLCDLKVSKEENLLKRSSAFDDNANYKKAVEIATGDEKKRYESYSEAVKKNIVKVKKRTVRLVAMPVVDKAFDTKINISVNIKDKSCNVICNRERTQIDATAYGEDRKWDDIIEVAAADEHIVGLRIDGGAYAAGINDDNRCNVVNWKDVTEVFVGTDISVGLKTDGTVFAVGNNIVDMWDALSWKDIKNVAVGDGFIISTDNKGEVHAVGANTSGQCNVDMWERVTQVAAGSNHSVGLCADGTVIATGNNNKGQCNVDEWKDIVAVAADKFATFGLRIDGTVVAEGFEGKEYKNWKDVFAICAQNGYLVAAKTDGTVVCEPADLKFSKTQLNMFKDTAADVQVKILSTAKELTQKDFNPFAAKLLKTVVNPKDKELYAMCENKQIPIDEIIYVKAGQLKDEGLSDAAKAAYQMLGDYKDSAQLMLICNVGVVEKAYKEAIECIKKGDYYTANYHLAKHAEYTDTTPELEAIKAEYIIAAYNKGSEAMDRQTFKIAKNIVATADSVEAKTDDKAIIEKIAESKFSFKAVAYEKASKAMEDEMYYDNAKELLTMIGDFKDSKELLAKCEKGLKERAVKEKALEEAIQKGKLEAEKKARETELKAQLEQLNEDLNNVPKFLGIPDKRKKAQIEEQIKIIQSEIDKLG